MINNVKIFILINVLNIFFLLSSENINITDITKTIAVKAIIEVFANIEFTIPENGIPSANIKLITIQRNVKTFNFFPSNISFKTGYPACL